MYDVLTLRVLGLSIILLQGLIFGQRRRTESSVDGFYWFEIVKTTEIQKDRGRQIYQHTLEIYLEIDRQIEPVWSFGPMFQYSCFKDSRLLRVQYLLYNIYNFVIENTIKRSMYN